MYLNIPYKKVLDVEYIVLDIYRSIRYKIYSSIKKKNLILTRSLKLSL